MSGKISKQLRDIASQLPIDYIIKTERVLGKELLKQGKKEDREQKQIISEAYYYQKKSVLADHEKNVADAHTRGGMDAVMKYVREVHTRTIQAKAAGASLRELYPDRIFVWGEKVTAMRDYDEIGKEAYCLAGDIGFVVSDTDLSLHARVYFPTRCLLPVRIPTAFLKEII